MSKTIDFETRCPRAEKPRPHRIDCANGSVELYFDEPPRIGNRSDALALLDELLEADYVQNDIVAFQALRDAIEREII
jgi:hypothetical protein